VPSDIVPVFLDEAQVVLFDVPLVVGVVLSRVPPVCVVHVLRRVRVNVADHAELATAIGVLGHILHIERSLRAQEAPLVRRGQNRIAVVLRHSAEVETFRRLREVSEGIDGVARRTDPVPNVLVERGELAVDGVGKLHHRRLDDALGQLTDFQGQVRGRELEIDAFLRIDGEGELAFDGILNRSGSARANREVSRAADRDRVADLSSR
jgi:hypothetical protein